MDILSIFGFNFTTITIILSSLTALYLYLTRNFNHWSKLGLKGPKPVILLGSLWEIFFKPLCEIEDQRRDKYGRIYGLFMGSTPILSVGEPELVKNIMIKDFHVFVNRQNIKTYHPVFDRALTIVQDDEWKNLRSVVSPTFSSAKMRKMHPLIDQCVKAVETILTKSAQEATDVELKKLMGNYTMDVISTCAFATKIDTHNDPNNPFIKYAIQLFRGSIARALVFFTVPASVRKYLKLTIADPEVMDFFINSIKSILNKRELEQNTKHTDFLQLMINAKKHSTIDDVNDDKLHDAESHHGHEENMIAVGNKAKIEITDNDIIATSFVFFLAGYETTGSLLSFLFYSLAINPDCQQKLYEELCDHLSSDGTIDYDTIARLPYLDACTSETLRLYNPAIQTLRISSEEYTLGDTGLVLPKGSLVQIPIHAIHHNPEFYPNPYRFDPERFMPENRDKLTPYTYLAFGAGPRNCVGMRFALMEAKTMIANVIVKYKFLRTEATKVPLKFRKFIGLLQTNDITVGVEMRQ